MIADSVEGGFNYDVLWQDYYESWASLLRSLNDGIRKLADEEAVHFADCSDVFTPITRRLMSDGLHPTVEGAEALAAWSESMTFQLRTMLRHAQRQMGALEHS